MSNDEMRAMGYGLYVSDMVAGEVPDFSLIYRTGDPNLHNFIYLYSHLV